eukprot:scaffold46183_cov17-Tisochrysis_lutea.AAC.6
MATQRVISTSAFFAQLAVASPNIKTIIIITIVHCKGAAACKSGRGGCCTSPWLSCPPALKMLDLKMHNAHLLRRCHAHLI